eukprot:CAMPEP_0181231540 /NCGR_PEP_ID=MMETSP1096-20121128/35164_1 /TAXON_ID=156174 ORGANISM="Chrysochromulina ericina, Strain CCMP281" /NCGR_SAMPLE_ID=MMETSP1096 /ASSEMBLY_ACC=CAM_ASM_000453 /LENGTH=113 /DNA_ID=CAMNT_0023325595 /DNA_START=251 /DNA_END=589 /DNA_ORIENTATION=-
MHPCPIFTGRGMSAPEHAAWCKPPLLIATQDMTAEPTSSRPPPAAQQPPPPTTRIHQHRHGHHPPRATGCPPDDQHTARCPAGLCWVTATASMAATALHAGAAALSRQVPTGT